MNRRTVSRIGIYAFLLSSAAFFLIPGVGHMWGAISWHSQPLDDVAAWAHGSTAKDAVFLFPDVGHGLQPGILRPQAAKTHDGR